MKYTLENLFTAVILLTHMENYNRGYHYSTIRTVLQKLSNKKKRNKISQEIINHKLDIIYWEIHVLERHIKDSTKKDMLSGWYDSEWESFRGQKGI